MCVCVFFLGQCLDLLLFFPGVWFPGSFVMGAQILVEVFCKQSTYETEWSLKLIIPEGIIIKAADTNCVIGRSNMSLFGMGRFEFCTNASVLHCKFHMQKT